MSGVQGFIIHSTRLEAPGIAVGHSRLPSAIDLPYARRDISAVAHAARMQVGRRPYDRWFVGALGGPIHRCVSGCGHGRGLNCPRCAKKSATSWSFCAAAYRAIIASQCRNKGDAADAWRWYAAFKTSTGEKPDAVYPARRKSWRASFCFWSSQIFVASSAELCTSRF